MDEYAELLSKWFEDGKRDFPWRKDRTPYKVLVSEIMLQQTIASVVVDYFNRWMERFPHFKELALADEADVIKMWEGLGYYSRARNLHGIAKRVMSEFDGAFPEDYQEILSFKGIGPYTAAAISHFAFGKRVLGCDGNIKKVMARFHGHQGYFENDKDHIDLLDRFLPSSNSKSSFEGLIELGATVCLKKPKCERCPLQGGCKAYAEELTDLIPLRKKRAQTIKLYRTVFVLEVDGMVLLRKSSDKLMQGLSEFPYLDGKGEDSEILLLEKELGQKIQRDCSLENVVHTFTKYKAHLYPIKGRLEHSKIIHSDYQFIPISKLKDLSFSSGHRKIYQEAFCE